MNVRSDSLAIAVRDLAPAMRDRLARGLTFPSVSGDEGPFVRDTAAFLADAGLTIDLWQADEADLAAHPVAASKHLPLANRPTLVATLPGSGGGRSLLFNAHSDVVAAPEPERWTLRPFAGSERDGRFYGRGACDVKGPLTSAIWAMLAIRAADLRLAGDVSLELVPGEEDCVTLGTLTSVVRGHSADGCVVLEPTEGLPRNASRPGLRFEIVCRGRAVHGTVKWLGADAIALAQTVLTGLRRLEAEWNDRTADPLFAAYPIARPVTVDTVRGGTWQGMVCDRCLVAGYLELLPGDDAAVWRTRFADAVAKLAAESGESADHVLVTFTEQYSGHTLHSDNPLCRGAHAAVGERFDWQAFNSGCEAGLRASLLGTPTLVWGPGSLAHAHAVDEYVDWADVETVAGRFARFAVGWAGRAGQ